MKSEIENIYNEISDILSDVMPQNASEINYYAQIYENHTSFKINFIINQELKWFDFGQTPRIAMDIIDLLKKIKYSNAGIGQDNKWTHCHITLKKDKNLDINFLYIPEENNWIGLYLKGISDLTEEESENLGIPKELWLERVKHKGTGILGRPKSYFY